MPGSGPAVSLRTTKGQPGAGTDGGGFGGPGGGPVGSNVLRDRMLEIDEFRSLYEKRLEELRAELIDSGLAAQIVVEWAEVLERDAADLVTGDAIATEAQRLTNGLTGSS